MAQTPVRYGDAEIIMCYPSTAEMINRLVAVDHWIEQVFNECRVFDLSGTRTLTDEETQAAAWDFIGTTGGDIDVNVSPNCSKSWWVRDRSTGGNITLKVLGGTGKVLPKNIWMHMAIATTAVNPIGGIFDHNNAPAISYGTNWAATAGRTPRLWKFDSSPTKIGGVCKLDGAVEKSVADPAANETMLTLPQYYRPGIKAAFVVPVNSDVITACEQLYGPQMLNCGLHGTQTYNGGGDEHPLKTYGKVTPAASGVRRAPWASRAAAIIGHSARFKAVTATQAGDVLVQTRVNGVTVFESTIAISTDDNTWYQVYATQDPPTDLIAIDDQITMWTRSEDPEFRGTILYNTGIIEIATYSIAGERRTTTVEIGTDGVMKVNGPLPLIGETVDLSGIEFQVGN